MSIDNTTDDQDTTAQFTHLNEAGEANMVDVSAKTPTRRVAIAGSRIRMQPATLRGILEHGMSKGDVLAVARIAGIQAARLICNWVGNGMSIPSASNASLACLVRSNLRSQ